MGAERSIRWREVLPDAFSFVHTGQEGNKNKTCNAFSIMARLRNCTFQDHICVPNRTLVN